MRLPTAVLLFLLASVAGLGETSPGVLLLSVNATTSGPVGGSESTSCIRIFSDGQVLYSYRWKGGGHVTDSATGRVIEHAGKERREYKLKDYRVSQLGDLLRSKAILKLASSYGPPHSPIDYLEVYNVEIPMADKEPKRIVTHEFYVSSLTERTRYPSALLVLMDEIERVEHEAREKGKDTDEKFACPHDK